MWQFDGRLAHWQGTTPEFSIDVQKPEMGLQQVRPDRSLPPLATIMLLRVELVRPGTATPTATTIGAPTATETAIATSTSVASSTATNYYPGATSRSHPAL